MTREESRIKKLQDEATELVDKNIAARDQIKKNLAMLKATAELIAAKGGQISPAVNEEMLAGESQR